MNNNELILLEKLKNENMESLTKRGRGTELEMYCSWIGRTKQRTVKEKARSLLYWYDSKTYKKRLKKYENLNLRIELKPGFFHGKTVRGSISQHLWLRKIRPVILSEFNYKCSICSFEPAESDRKQLQVHEVEKYYLDNSICELLGLELICGSCHSFHHIGRTYGVSTSAKMKELINHFTKVNKVDEEDYHEYFKLLKCMWRDESIKKLDERTYSDILSNRDKKVRFKISCDIPYKEEVINQLKKKDIYVEDGREC
jgi:hypothetical protein